MIPDPHLPTWVFKYRVKLTGTVIIEASDQRVATAIFQKISKPSLMQNVSYTSTSGPTATVLSMTRFPPTGSPRDDPYPAD